MGRQSRAVPVLLTRPAMQADRFAADLAARFGDAVDLVTAPLLAPVFLAPRLPPGASALILTSETAVKALAELDRDGLPNRAWCVGNRTAAAATTAGLTATSAGGDAASLVTAILAASETGPLLHLRGAETRGDVAGTLARHGVAVHEAVVYDQKPQPLSAAAAALLAEPGDVIVPLFSPRTAALFSDAARGARARLHLCHLSAAVQKATALPGPASDCVARRPDAAAMIDCIGRTLAGLLPT